MEPRDLYEGLRGGHKPTVDKLAEWLYKWAAKNEALTLQDAEDIAVETIVRAHRRIERCENPDSFVSWVFGIARNVLLEHLRKNKRTTTTESIEELLEREDAAETSSIPPIDDPEETLISREYIKDAKAVLSDQERKVVEMQTEDQLSGEEIAEKLGISPNAVYTTFYRATRKMRDVFRSVEDT